MAWTFFPRNAPFPITMDNSAGNFKFPINAADINGDGKKAKSVNDLIIKSGNLTINNNSTISMATNAMVIVMSKATLEIDSAHILNANVKALAGSNVIIRNNGYIKLGPKGDFTTEAGSNVEILSGSIE